MAKNNYDKEWINRKERKRERNGRSSWKGATVPQLLVSFSMNGPRCVNVTFQFYRNEKKKNEGERKRSIERLWVEKCPAGREGAFNTISCHLHLENVPTGRSKGVLALGSLRCRLLSELPIHGSHWRNDFPSRHCSHFVSFHWSPLLRRCSSSTRLRGDDQW